MAAALGYDRIMLNGTSFGSQWSFAIMRLHPDIVARALLSGVEPLDHGYDMPSDVFAAVQRMWRTVDDDARFAPYLPPGGMAEAALAVIERLEREPLVIAATGRSGKTRTVGVFGPADFRGTSRRRFSSCITGSSTAGSGKLWGRGLDGGSRFD